MIWICIIFVEYNLIILKYNSCFKHNLTSDSKYLLKQNRRMQDSHHTCPFMVRYYTRFKEPSYFLFVRARSIRNIDRIIISAKLYVKYDLNCNPLNAVWIDRRTIIFISECLITLFFSWSAVLNLFLLFKRTWITSWFQCLIELRFHNVLDTYEINLYMWL